MTALVQHLAKYAAYHRNPRNIATHMIGIPTIVLAVEVLLSRPVWAVGSFAVTPAMPIAVVVMGFYLSLDLWLGGLAAVLLALGAWLGLWVAALPTADWLAIGIGAFVAGWILQFVGHAFEGRKPAFADDVMGLLIGPLFVLAEIVFAFGLRRGTRDAMAAAVRGSI